MLLHHARRRARLDPAGELVLLEDQDRSLWERNAIEEGSALVEASLRRGVPGPYLLQAAIAAVHAGARSFEDVDWAQIAALFDLLLRVSPSPIVELNRAVAVAMHEGPSRGLQLIDGLIAGRRLEGFHLLHAARADLLRRLGRLTEAEEAYVEALACDQNAAERRYLLGRLAEVRGRARA
jgi:RNA polymerase sigma-70 factor (ECF subfamily)